MNEHDLIKLAIDAQDNAYAPYSNFRVGAALLTANGKVYTGCNVENVSFGGTICAERVAACKAISEGERSFTAIAITSSSGELTFPCGICRQFLLEFSPTMKVILSNKNSVSVFLQNELLPHSFSGF